MVRARRNHTEACRDWLEENIVATTEGVERVRRAEARRERELDERLQQEDVCIGADGNARPTADVPSDLALGTPRSRTTLDVYSRRRPNAPVRDQRSRLGAQHGSHTTSRSSDRPPEQQGSAERTTE